MKWKIRKPPGVRLARPNKLPCFYYSEWVHYKISAFFLSFVTSFTSGAQHAALGLLAKASTAGRGGALATYMVVVCAALPRLMMGKALNLTETKDI